MYIGIDIGTTNCKVGLYDIDGSRISSAEFVTPTIILPTGWAEYDMDEMWERLKITVSKTMKDHGSEVKAIGVSSQGESCVLTDRQFHPLTNAIPWFDNRTKDISDAWKKRMDEDEIYRITGLALQPIYTIMKLEWFKENSPVEYEKAYCFHCMSDYIAGRMSGVHAMSYSMAARTMAFDLNARNWSEILIGLSKVNRKIFPNLVRESVPLGYVSSEFAEEWGISRKCSVSIAGFDHMVGCYGVGADSTNTVVASIGTTESICFNEKRINTLDKYYGYVWGCHVFDDTYCSIGGIPAGGQTIDWIIKTVLRKTPSEESYKEVAELASESPILSNGVLFLPHLYGCLVPEMDSESSAIFYGMKNNTKTSDLIRAVMEGLCYEFRLVLEQGKKKSINEIIAIGGGVKNEFWIQCHADVLGIPVCIMNIEDAVTYGGAHIAARGRGDTRFGVNQSNRIEKRYIPDEKRHKLYDQIFRKTYVHLYEMQKKIFQY